MDEEEILDPIDDSPPLDPSELELKGITVIDVDTSYPFENVVHVKQYDTVRVVEAHLFTSGVKWYVPSDNIYAMVSYKKSDHIGGFYDVTENNITAVTVDGEDRSIIYVTLDAQIMRTASSLEYPTFVEVVFYEQIRGDRLSTFSFKVEVEEASVREVDLASNPYFNILAENITAVLNINEALTGITATVTKLAPNTDPVVTVTGGSDGNPYHLAFALPSMPGMTASATKLAPNATPTATITGGSIAGEAFNVNLGIPSMPGMTATVQALPEGTPPTVAVTGGTVAGQAYNVEFGIPYASSPTVTSIEYKYALSESGTVAPSSGWQNSIADLGGQDALKGKFLWSRAIANWSSGGQSINYACAYNGMDAQGSVTSINGRDGIVTLRMTDLFSYVGRI